MSSLPSFFDRFPMQAVHSDGLDAVLAQPGAALSVLFLWGRDCPNCDVAKAALQADPSRFLWPGVRWLHTNVYEDPAMGVRFGLHGVPAFIVFRGSTRLGRISPWPGVRKFCEAIERQLG